MPRIVDHDQRREEILERCFSLFASQGYAALSMRGIARSLQFSTGSLYYYFDSKEAIFEAMFRRLATRNVEAVLATLPEDATPQQRILNLGRFLMTEADALEQAIAVALEYRRQQTGPEADAVLRGVLAVYRDTIAEQMGLSDSREATVALSLLLGMLVHRRLDPDAIDIGAHLIGLSAVLGIR
jgi:AcrR family transcriptional regulator